MSNPIPMTWAELLAQTELRKAKTLETLRTLGEIALSGDSGLTVAGDLAVPAILLGRLAVASGSAACHEGVTIFEEVAHRSLKDLEGGLAKTNPTAAMGPLRFENAAHACGHSLAGELLRPVVDSLEALVSGRDQLTEIKCQTLALACVVHGRTDLVPELIASDTLPDRFEPGRTFGFNEQAFIGYLSAARDTGATRDDVQPAWLDFLAWFPRKLAAETLEWDDVVFAGRILHVPFGGDLGQTVAAWLYDQVRQ